MSKIRLTVDEKFINELKDETGVDNTSKLADEAFTLFKWAVDEIKKGRVLVSMNNDGTDGKKVQILQEDNTK